MSRPRPWRLRQAGLAAGLLLCASGLGLLGYALYMPAKATLGQILLERSWRQSQAAAETGTPRRFSPWPWADVAPAARLTFPSLGESRLVLDRASGEAMAWGPGHVSGTQPFGAPGISAVAAHRDTHFALLGRVGPGDPIELETPDGARRVYRVVSARVVNAERWRFPTLRSGPNVLALSTCWPLDSMTPGPERLIVFAMPFEAPPAREPEALEMASEAEARETAQ